MPATLAGRRCQVLVDIEARRAGNVPGEVEFPALAPDSELPAAVHELVVHPGIVTPNLPGGVFERTPKGAVMKLMRIAILAAVGAAVVALAGVGRPETGRRRR